MKRRNNFYNTVQDLKAKGIPIIQETTEQYLARGGKIKQIPFGECLGIDELNKLFWNRNSVMRPGNGKLQKMESENRIDDLLGV